MSAAVYIEAEKAMRFLCLGYADEKKWDAMSKIEIDAAMEECFELMCCIDEHRWEALPAPRREKIMEEYGTFIAGIKSSGHYLAGAKLDRSSHAVTVRQKNGKPVITDGPFAETKEQLGGYQLVECRDRDEAVAFAMRIPTLDVGGTVEVRALLQVSERS
jgi:hypothetical protein